jgi:hypothetical protein
MVRHIRPAKQHPTVRGSFTSIRTRKRLVDLSEKKHCLIKNRDEYADPSWDIEGPDCDRSFSPAVA